jgi:hypothetical protein
VPDDELIRGEGGLSRPRKMRGDCAKGLMSPRSSEVRRALTPIIAINSASIKSCHCPCSMEDA